MTPEDAAEYTDTLGALMGVGYRQLALGVKMRAPQALGLTRPQWIERVGGAARLALEDRLTAVAELAADGMSNRAIADVLGVGETTVRRDLDPAPNGASELGDQEALGAIAPNGALEPEPHVTRNSGVDEWYTPSEYLNAARDVLGAIDLDPASSPAANKTVRAERYYTADDDGLTRPWCGRVWMNPPYSTGLVDRFVAKLLDAYQTGDVPAAVVLTNNATDTRWWQSLARRSSAVCLLAGRIRFRTPDGDVAGAGLQGQTICYLGENARGVFVERFREFGVVL
jgi:ParB family chromosome partitioning protein